MNIDEDINDILNNLENGRTVKFIYAPKNTSKINERDFINHPLYGYYNNFFLKKNNNKLELYTEDNKKIKTNAPKKLALDMFYSYYDSPDFSTMIALTDNFDNNLIFYNSDIGKYSTDFRWAMPKTFRSNVDVEKELEKIQKQAVNNKNTRRDYVSNYDKISYAAMPKKPPSTIRPRPKMNIDIEGVINNMLGYIENGRTIKFIYAPKNTSKINERDFIKHPLYGYYNNFFLKKNNNKFEFYNEDNKKIKTEDPLGLALDMFYSYYNNPDFSTMVALTDNFDDNLIFFNSDNGKYITYFGTEPPKFYIKKPRRSRKLKKKSSSVKRKSRKRNTSGIRRRKMIMS
jgi:hypothetical protein